MCRQDNSNREKGRPYLKTEDFPDLSEHRILRKPLCRTHNPTWSCERESPGSGEQDHRGSGCRLRRFSVPSLRSRNRAAPLWNSGQDPITLREENTRIPGSVYGRSGKRPAGRLRLSSDDLFCRTFHKNRRGRTDGCQERVCLFLPIPPGICRRSRFAGRRFRNAAVLHR